MSNPAFPTPDFYEEQMVGVTDGLTKRELFAAMAMQGFLASQSMDWNSHPPEIARSAVVLADELIKALKKSS